MIDYETLLKMWREEKKKRQEVEGELSIIKATTVDNSPEMRNAKKEIDRITEKVNNFFQNRSPIKSSYRQAVRSPAKNT